MSLGTTDSPSPKSQILSSLSRWQGALVEAQRPLFQAFVDAALERIRGPFLSHHPPRTVLSYLEEAFRFAQKRRQEIEVAITPRATRGVSVFTCMPDQAFIVDTTRLYLRSNEADPFGGFHLVFPAVRDAEGNLVGIGGDNAQPESLGMLEADQGKLTDLAAAAEALRSNLEQVRVMVRDFKAMTRSIERFVERCEVLADRRPDQSEGMRETSAFLKWLIAENFVFMGIEDGATPFGIQTLSTATRIEGDWPQPHYPGTVSVRKSAIESRVHRAGRIDEIKVVVADGTDEHRLLIRGMFTYRAVTQPSRHVPILRGVLSSILNDMTSTGPGSFRYKGIANVYDSLPTEFLFTAPRSAIIEMVERVFESEQQQDAGVTFTMNGPGSAFCLLAMPKSHFSDDLRRQLEREIVTTTRATYCDHGVFVGRYETVLLHYYLTGVIDPGEAKITALTTRIRDIASPWFGRLWNAIVASSGELEADRLLDLYGSALPESFTRATSVDRMVRDLQQLEQARATGQVHADVYEDGTDLFLRVYQANNVFLSDLMPVLASFGVKVIDSYATQVPLGAPHAALHIDTFRLQGADGIDKATLLARSELLTDALTQVFTGRTSDDRLNGLVLVAGLTWAEVDMLRGYMRYSRQIGMKLSIPRMIEIMLANPIMFGTLVELFRTRFDPDRTGDRAAQLALASQKVTDELRYIQAHDEDLLVSTVRNLIESTVRTNYYRTDRVSHYLSFKFDAKSVRMMPANRPMFEIYVHSRDVEGVHLRFGSVARGGIRWSDRDDFRTEVLGLVTTQRVKNVVIVPTGSKGGFFLKNASRDPAERRRQADDLYQTFIRGLLDVTDNSAGGKILPPPRVVRHDPDDPYLVVAADKGTAHLSDTANRLSLAYGFWLGDAFASGGSNGYDHKKVGITARGAWVLAKRHFAEMGIDPYNQDVTVIGVGDMGGDVFGNGLIESKHLKLRAAFNHIHIFLDPNPDAARSFEERSRLFRSVGGWDKYDTSLLSKGGGIFDRRAKSVPLSPECRAMLGIDREEAEPEEVIKAILCMEADLWWNGGIGTYVKASTETHADADDRSNDAVRIDAKQLRVKVVGEGGNLGLTQKARIEAALMGVRLNNDAMDNSGGVDLSDHEVNIKILLNGIVAKGGMSLEERNKLLEQMTDEVASLVLEDNDAHGRQLSRDEIRSKQNIFPFARAIAFIEREFGRDRASLDLPSEAELERRTKANAGLTRPELAVLSSWMKMYVKRELLKGDLKQIPGHDVLLAGYFPKPLQERFPAEIQSHMLAHEIVVTVVTTRIFADAGASLYPLVLQGTGSSVAEITNAYRKASRMARFHEVRAVLEQLRATVALDTLYRAWVDVDEGARDVAIYWLSSSGTVPQDDVLDEMRTTAERIYDLQSSTVLAKNSAHVESLRASGIPEDVAKMILRAQYLNIALAVYAEAKRTGSPVEVIGVRHLAVGRASRLQEIVDELSSRPATGRWEPLALRILHTRFHNLLNHAISRCAVDTGGGITVDQLEQQLQSGRLADVRAQVDEVIGTQTPTVSALLVLEERVASAIARL